MKVLMINVVCGIRSTGRICTDLAIALEAQGHEVKIAYGRESVPEQFSRFAVRIGSNCGNKLHGVKARVFDGCGFGSKTDTEKFIQWMKAFDPDIIHLHNLHGYFVNIEVLFNYLKTCGKRIIWTLHDCWAFTGHCAYYSSANCEKWITGCEKKCPNQKQYPMAWFSRADRNYKEKKYLFSGVAGMTLVTPSKWLSSEVSKSFLNEYPVEVIYNGVDTSFFSPKRSDLRKKYNILQQKIILGVASVWEERKGLNTFLNLSKYVDDSYTIVLIGLSKQQMQNLPYNIVGIERTNDVENLAKWYSTADVFFNPSLEETFGLTTAEAINCGTPCVVFDSTASVEIIAGTSKGFVVPKEDFYHMNKIKSVIDYAISAKELPIESVFSKGDQIVSYMRLYEQGKN